MKILLATFWAIPHIGGVWNYMSQLKKMLEALGHEVDLLGYGEGNKYIHIVNQNKRIQKDELPPFYNTELNVHSHRSLYADPVVKFYEKERHFFEQGVNYLGLEKYDLIHSQDVLSTACINRIRPQKTPLIASLHGCVAHELKHYVNNIHKTPTSDLACEYFDGLEHEGAISAEFTIVANQWLKNILINEFHVPEKQLKVFHYGYDTETFLNRMKESSDIQRPDDKKVIIYAGRLTELKGINHLISALGQLKEIRNDWVCWIVGDGNNRTQLQDQSKDLGLEKDIFFFGKRDDIPYLLSISDIFVLPSLLENQPLSVIEAQIAGKAVIVSNAGGLPEIVEHGMTGIISPAGDAKALCMHLNYLLKHEKYMESLGYRAQKWGLDYWSLDKAVSNVLDVYQNAISMKESPGSSNSKQ